MSDFVSLATQGREALDRGLPEEAEGIFDRALALWRVAPLADFRFGGFAQAEARRLHEAMVADTPALQAAARNWSSRSSRP